MDLEKFSKINRDKFLQELNSSTENIFNFSNFVNYAAIFCSATTAGQDVYNHVWFELESINASALDEWEDAGRPKNWQNVWDTKYRSDAQKKIEKLKKLIPGKDILHKCGYLKCWLLRDDGTGALFAEININGFSGIGHAYFDLADLTLKVKKFADYPLLKDQPVCIAGGIWENDAKTIKQEHLKISVYPTNSLGELGLLVKLAEPHGDHLRDGKRFSLSVELKTDYEKMAQFSKDLLSLIQGNIDEVLLYSNI